MGKPFRPEDREYDIIVVGGGLSGICAAIAASENGAKVGLVHDRPVLGGPSSSEIGVLPTGSEYGRYRYARETGLIEKLRMKERVLHPQSALVIGQIDATWDATLWEAVYESGVELFLNCTVYDIEMDGARIVSVFANQSGSERQHHLHAKQFIDCTGDGTVAALAGAPFRFGREAKTEFNESLGQDVADKKTLCSSLLFRVKEFDRPMPFVAPSWAYKYPREEDLLFRDHKYIKSGYWWIEAGGTIDTIRDNEEIRVELMKMVYGVWDHIKNYGPHGADNMALEFVALLPGKRESRRIIGDYTLCQDDLYNPKDFEDSVAYGGWFIDFHLSEGMHSPLPPADNYYLNRVYPIPLRCLYSPYVDNLMMAGRDASFTHVALMTTRVMSTCAVMGEAAGVLASLCIKKSIKPSVAAKNDIKQIQQILLKRDCYIPGVRNQDECDLALRATVTATSESPLSITAATSYLPIQSKVSQVIAFSPDKLDAIRLFIRNNARFSTPAKVSVYEAEDFWDWEGRKLGEDTEMVPISDTGFITFRFDGISVKGPLLRFEIESNDYLELGLNDNLIIGTQANLEYKNYPERELEGRGIYNYFLKWKNMPFSVLFNTDPVSYPFGAKNVISGVARPDKDTNIWISDPSEDMPQSITLSWDSDVEFDTVHLKFDTDLSHCIWSYPAPIKACVCDYSVEAFHDGHWKCLTEVRDNYQRHNIIKTGKTIASGLRINVLRTHGDTSARIYEIRVYDERENAETE